MRHSLSWRCVSTPSPIFLNNAQQVRDSSRPDGCAHPCLHACSGQTQANFGLNLRATAKSQEPEVQALKSQSQEALNKALQDAQRLKTLQSFLAKRKRQRQLEQEKHEVKALEDVLQARQITK